MAISPSPFDKINRTRRRSRGSGWIVFVAAVLLIGAGILLRGPLTNLFWYATEPVLGLRDRLATTEIERLRGELAAAQARLADRDVLHKENVDLKVRLGRVATPEQRTLAAVLQKAPWVPYDTLLVDAGANEGVLVGDTAYAAGQTVVGRVVEVSATTARVELLSTPGATYQALLKGALPVAVEGQGGGSMRAEVPAGTEVVVGDPVQFPGIFGGLAGSVSVVDAKVGESFIVIYMALPVNPQDLRFVELAHP
jgi:cell shape-determining protein MreC